MLRGRYKKGQVARDAIDDRTSKTIYKPRRISYHSDMGASIPGDADTAALPTILFSSLTSRDPNELDKLLKAWQGVGYFYLDLRGAASKNILQDWRFLLDFMELYFGQDLAKKMPDDRKSDTHG